MIISRWVFGRYQKVAGIAKSAVLAVGLLFAEAADARQGVPVLPRQTDLVLLTEASRQQSMPILVDSPGSQWLLVETTLPGTVVEVLVS